MKILTTKLTPVLLPERNFGKSLQIEYIPERGDLVWIDFDPHAGSEQKDHRPAIVLSPSAYNGKTGLAIFCPITSHSKGYPFEVSLPLGLKISGVILSDHVKSLDWKARGIRNADLAPDEVVREVLEKLNTLMS